jgi:hypothetical protein
MEPEYPRNMPFIICAHGGCYLDWPVDKYDPDDTPDISCCPTVAYCDVCDAETWIVAVKGGIDPNGCIADHE